MEVGRTVGRIVRQDAKVVVEQFVSGGVGEPSIIDLCVVTLDPEIRIDASIADDRNVQLAEAAHGASQAFAQSLGIV
jgi:hypothetical protein